jgi:type II secretory pathway predicted ATPase ExeA
MYTKYFGFRINPFKANPDSAYFFPGKSHLETIAHLHYAISQREGFVLIIGEKGIGKTTICTYFLQNPDEKTIVVFIPKAEQSPKRLLKRILKELSISTISDNMKDYFDALNNFLIQKAMVKIKVVFLLDEAHKFNSDVLEQIRLLSNLETTREKLLHIILIGCPELEDRLDSYELRPLRQRMSVIYHVYPLSQNETSQYITHRITKVGQGDLVKFDASAFSHIYKYSGGIPRLVNQVCDRVLMSAYKLREKQISGIIAKTAIKELPVNSVKQTKANYQFNRKKLISLVCSLFLIIIAAIFVFKPSSQKINSNLPQIERIEDVLRSNDQKVISDSFKGPKSPNIDNNRTNSRVNHLKRPVIYSVQIGAFLISNYAHILMDSLKEKGYQARIDTFNDYGGRTWYTVRIGEYYSRKLAQEKADSIITQEKMEAIVRSASQL